MQRASILRSPQSTISRRGFLQGSAASLFCAALGSACGPARPRHATPKDAPNVLFITIDDLNDWVGCLGNPQAHTPNLDALAARGTLFTNGHCASPICNASRASVLTGLAPTTTGVYRNDQPFRLAVGDAVTLPQYFMDHGYRVVGTGKIFHTSYPDQRSWHEYYLPMVPVLGDIPYLVRNVPESPLPEGRPVNGLRGIGAFDWAPLDVADDEMGDGRVAAWAASQLRERSDRPLFLGAGLNRPHLSWYVPRRYFDLYPIDDIVLPHVNAASVDTLPPMAAELLDRDVHETIVGSGQWARAVQGYLAATSFADAMLGRILDALYAGPYADDTIVVFWSDHGYHLGEKLCWGKATLWEESTRSPLLVVDPRASAGAAAEAASSLDLYPTLVELCGLTPRDDLDGRSLAAFMEDPQRVEDRVVVTTQYPHRHAARSRHHRLIRYEDGSEELYDHRDDPEETRNLSGQTGLAAVRDALLAALPRHAAEPSPRGFMNFLRHDVYGRLF